MEYQALNLLTAPSTEPVTIAELKSQLRLDGTDQDTMLTSLITSARQGVEKYLGRALITQIWQAFFDCFYYEMHLPFAPYQSITHIKYYDSDGNLQTLDSDYYQYDLFSVPARIKEAYGYNFPTTRYEKLNAVEIQYVAGYGDDTTDVPEPIRQLILGIAVDLYEHPEMNVELRINENKAYHYLAINYKIPVVA